MKHRNCWNINIADNINEVDSEHLDKLCNYRRRLFTPEEDRLIIELVTSKACTNWSQIAAKVSGRSSRQVRDRWTNYLSPANSLSPWNKDEDQMVVDLVNKVGTRWTTIAKILNNRSDNTIKNRWYSVLKSRCSVTQEGVYTLEDDPAKVKRCRGLKRKGKGKEKTIDILETSTNQDSKNTSDTTTNQENNEKNVVIIGLPKMTTNDDDTIWDRAIGFHINEIDNDLFREVDLFEQWFHV